MKLALPDFLRHYGIISCVNFYRDKNTEAGFLLASQDVSIVDEDFLLESYDYPLPENAIAQFPSKEQGSSRLMVLPRHPEKTDAGPLHTHFSRLADYLPKNAVLVANNSRVLPARMYGQRRSGGKAELLILTPVHLVAADAQTASGQRLRALGIADDADWNSALAQCLLRPSARIAKGDLLKFSVRLYCEVLEKQEFGRHIIRLLWRGDLEDIFNDSGQMPLPPYIRRAAERLDQSRYQTCYAKRTGSVAAPTAGLHFTPAIKRELEERGFQWLEVSLDVGYGTFSPVRCQDIRQHAMHSEYVELDAATADKLEQAKRDGRPLVAVGTTSLRALEGIFAECGKITPYAGWINIFLYPGSKFNVADGLITNFHLPHSSLLMLVSAFAGRKHVLGAYAEALKKGYKFFSYGDAMLLA